MAVEAVKTINIQGAFSKGLIADKGTHLFPVEYSPFLRNVRTVNSSCTLRKGYRSIYTEGSGGTYIRGIVANQGLYAVYNSKFREIDVDNNTATDRGTLSGDYDVNFVVYGPYIIILSGQGFPYVYNINTQNFSQLTNSNIATNANPIYGTQFAFLSLVAGTGENANTLYISRGATKSNPEYIYDWAGSGAEQRVLNSDILALASTLDRVFVFTEKTIEVLDRSSTTLTSGYVSFITTPIAGENQPASNRSVVVADDAVFFLTKNKQIKTLNYIPGITESQVGDLSNRENQSIQGFLDSIDDDQSKSFGYFDSNENKVYRHLREKGETFNTIVLVYDVLRDTFFVDNNKFFSCCAEFNKKYYCGSGLNTFVYQDNIGSDDDGQPISRERRTVNINFGSPNERKQFREIGLSGQINNEAIINVQVIVDGENAFSGQITGDDIVPTGIAANPIGQKAIAGGATVSQLQDFERYISRGDLRVKGKKIQIIFSGNEIAQDFSISTLSIGVRAVGTPFKRDQI